MMEQPNAGIDENNSELVAKIYNIFISDRAHRRGDIFHAVFVRVFYVIRLGKKSVGAET